MPTITLPDGKNLDFQKKVTGLEVAEKISKSLLKQALVISVDGNLKDLNFEIKNDCSVKIHTSKDKEGIETIINEKTGFLFDSGDANSLSKKIVRAITMDETSLKLIGKEGRKNIIKKFNVEKMCFSTYSEYKKLLN